MKRCVFSLLQNKVSESVGSRSDGGKEFYSLGAQAAKLRGPKLDVQQASTCKSPQATECRWWRLVLAVTGMHNSWRYCGAVWWRHLKMIVCCNKGRVLVIGLAIHIALVLSCSRLHSYCFVYVTSLRQCQFWQLFIKWKYYYYCCVVQNWTSGLYSTFSLLCFCHKVSSGLEKITRPPLPKFRCNILSSTDWHNFQNIRSAEPFLSCWCQRSSSLRAWVCRSIRLS